MRRRLFASKPALFTETSSANWCRPFRSFFTQDQCNGALSSEISFSGFFVTPYPFLRKGLYTYGIAVISYARVILTHAKFLHPYHFNGYNYLHIPLISQAAHYTVSSAWTYYEGPQKNSYEFYNFLAFLNIITFAVNIIYFQLGRIFHDCFVIHLICCLFILLTIKKL